MKLSTSLTALVVMIAVSTTAPLASGSSLASQGSHRRSPLHNSVVRAIRRTIVGSDGSVTEAEEDDEFSQHHLHKRYGGRASFYNNEVSEGACGGYSSNSDFVVAMNVAQYGNPNARSSWCGKQISISYGGKTHSATVVDCCPSCPPGGLDMSPGLFAAFAPKSKGLFQMSWSGGSGGSQSNNDDQDQEEEKPKTTHTPKPKTHTSTHHTTTSTHTSHSSTSTSTSTTSTSTTSTSTTSSSTSSEKSPTAAPALENLAAFNAVAQGLQNMALAGHQA